MIAALAIACALNTLAVDEPKQRVLVLDATGSALSADRVAFFAHAFAAAFARESGDDVVTLHDARTDAERAAAARLSACLASDSPAVQFCDDEAGAAFGAHSFISATAFTDAAHPGFTLAMRAVNGSVRSEAQVLIDGDSDDALRAQAAAGAHRLLVDIAPAPPRQPEPVVVEHHAPASAPLSTGAIVGYGAGVGLGVLGVVGIAAGALSAVSAASTPATTTSMYGMTSMSPASSSLDLVGAGMAAALAGVAVAGVTWQLSSSHASTAVESAP